MAAVASSLMGEADVELVVAADFSTDGSGAVAAALAHRLADPGRFEVKVGVQPRRRGGRLSNRQLVEQKSPTVRFRDLLEGRNSEDSTD